MKRNVALLVCLLLHVHRGIGADDTRSIIGRWEANMPGNGELLSVLTIEADGTFTMRGKSNDKAPNVWTGRYALLGDILELVFNPRDAIRSHATLKLKWDQASETLSPHAVKKGDGSETEPNARDQAIRYWRVPRAFGKSGATILGTSTMKTTCPAFSLAIGGSMAFSPLAMVKSLVDSR